MVLNRKVDPKVTPGAGKGNRLPAGLDFIDLDEGV
jgi:hypothetical protein